MVFLAAYTSVVVHPCERYCVSVDRRVAFRMCLLDNTGRILRHSLIDRLGIVSLWSGIHTIPSRAKHSTQVDGETNGNAITMIPRCIISGTVTILKP